MAWTIVITVVVTVLAVALAMNFTTPEKKLERKIEHRYAVSDPQFRREMSVMLGPAILPGNRVTDLQNGDEIFPAMLEAIRGATTTITFETYIYWSGDIGKEFADALAERARAGVTVKVMVDWVGSIKMDDDLLQADEGRRRARSSKYRPLHWYNLGRLNNRTHRKLLVVDGRIGFTGGVGIADQWLGHAAGSRSTGATRTSGSKAPAVAQLQAAFNDNWIKTTGEVLNGADYFPPLAAGARWSAPVHRVTCGRQREHAPDVPDGDRRGRASDRPRPPYFVPDELIIEALHAARQRGVRVRVLVPGPAHRFGCRAPGVTRRLGRAAAGRRRDPRVPADDAARQAAGGRRRLVSVGSTNFDIRSFRLNDEASLNVYDRLLLATWCRYSKQTCSKASDTPMKCGRNAR